MKKRWKDRLNNQENCKIRENYGQQVIRYHEYYLSSVEWMLAVGKGIGGCALVSYIFYRNWLSFFLMLPIVLICPILERNRQIKKRYRQLSVEFQDGAMALAAALSAGYSVENALSVSVRELAMIYGENGLIVREFSYMAGQVRMNRPVEQVLTEFGERSGLEDIRNFAEVFTAAKRTGGALAEILRHTASVLQDKVQVQEEIAVMTASRQFEQKIMNFLPFLIVIYIDLTSPGFFTLMYGSMIGRILMSVCLFVYLAACGIAVKILNIEV